MKKLENHRLLLRELEIDDLQDMFEFTSDERVTLYAGWDPHKTIDETRDLLEKLRDSNQVWGIYHKVDKKIIGTIGLHYGKFSLVDSKVYALGFELNQNYWGEGYMKDTCDLVLEYLFIEDNKIEIYANHFDFNHNSGKFLNKYGFKLVGDWINKKGVTNYLYKLRKEDYQELKVIHEETK